MERKYFGFKGFQNRNSKFNKLASLRQISNNISTESIETVQKNRVSPKLSRLEKLRAYREDKDLKKKIQLKTKRPPFKPSGPAQPRSAETSPVLESQVKIPKPSFIPRIGSLKPPSIFVKKQIPKDVKQNSVPKELVKANSSTAKSVRQKVLAAARFESLSPGFPSDISCIEPVKDISFAPIEFTFSGVENVDQFDFMPVATLQSLPETVLARRSTPIKTTPVYSSFRRKENAVGTNVSSQKSFTIQKVKPASLENAKRISTPRSLIAKPSANSSDIKIKSESKTQSMPPVKSVANSSAMSSELSSTLLKSEKEKPLPEHRIACTRNSHQDKSPSLLVSGKTLQQDNGENSSGSIKQTKEFGQSTQVVSSKISQQDSKKNSSGSFKPKGESGHTTKMISGQISQGSKNCSSGSIKQKNEFGQSTQTTSGKTSQQSSKNCSGGSFKHKKESGHVAQVISSKISQQNNNKNSSGSLKHKKEPGSTTQTNTKQVISNKNMQRVKALENSKNKHNNLEHKPFTNLQRNPSVKGKARPLLLKQEKDHEKQRNAENEVVVPKEIAIEDKVENEGDKNETIIKLQDIDNNSSNVQSVSIEGNPSDGDQRTVIKSVTSVRNKSEVGDKTVIKPSLLENNGKIMAKFLLAEQIEDDNVLIDSASFERIEGEDDETMIETVSYEEKKSEDGETTLIMSVSSKNDKVMKSFSLIENDEESFMKPVLHDIHEQTTVLLCEKGVNDKTSETSIFGSYKCDNLEVMSSGDKSKQLGMEVTESNLLVEKLSTKLNSAQKYEIDCETTLLHEACSICAKLICCCVLVATSQNKTVVALKGLTSDCLALDYVVHDDFPENHKNENVHSSISGEEVLDADQSNKLYSDFSDKTLNVSDYKHDIQSKQFQHEDSLIKMKEILPKVFHQSSVKDNSYIRSLTATPLQSITNTISKRELPRKIDPNIKETLSDENALISQELFDINEEMNRLNISSNLSDFSFIENEEMPMVNLEALDNTLDISAFSDVRNTPKVGRGIKFFHYQELEDTASPGCCSILKNTPLKELSGYIAASKQASDLGAGSQIEIKQSPFDTPLKMGNDATLPSIFKLAEDSTLENSEQNLCETSVIVDEDSPEGSNIPLSSMSLLCTPQILKPLREQSVLNDLITFSPFVKF